VNRRAGGAPIVRASFTEKENFLDSGHGREALRLSLDALPSRLVQLALYSKPVCNLIDLTTFDSSPLDRLIVVATPERHCMASKKHDNITFARTVVASHTNFGRMRGVHDFRAQSFEMVKPVLLKIDCLSRSNRLDCRGSAEEPAAAFRYRWRGRHPGR
jgi:hypothetical protein